MTGREKVCAAAEQFGWTMADSGPDWIVWEKRVPMIHRKDEDRLLVTFDGLRVIAAHYGPDRRSRELHKPLLASVLDHLIKIGQEKRST
jgi:hypothetical protein